MHHAFVDGDGSLVEVDVSAQTQMKLFTGGKAGEHRLNLIQLQCAATAYGQPPVSGWFATPQTPVASGLRALGKAVGNDGNLWVALPDNAALDLNLTAPGVPHYDATATVQKYQLVIQVNNSVTLDPDVVVDGATNFWVGQYLNFTAGFIPALPEAPEVTANLWAFDGIFVNDHTNANANSSDNYFKNPANLTTPSAPAWWVAGDNSTTLKSQLTANFAEALTFANGQNVIANAKGLFDMYRPQAHVVTTTSTVTVDNNLPDDPIAVHYDGVNEPGILFSNTVLITSGNIQWLQVVNNQSYGAQWNSGSWLGPYTHSNGLDNTDPYDSGTTTEDSPSYGILIPSSFQEITDSQNFSMWLEFKPNGGIAVPLRVVNWTWNGTGVRSGTNWVLTTDPNPDPNPSDLDTTVFPAWTNVVKNKHH